MSSDLFEHLRRRSALGSVCEDLGKGIKQIPLHLPTETGRLLASAALHANQGRTTLLVFRRSSELDSARPVIESFLPQHTILNFLAWEILPYERMIPHRSITAERVNTLHALMNGEQPAGGRVILTTVRALLQRVMAPELLKRFTLTLSFGDELNRELFLKRLTAMGYEPASQVQEEGTFAARGGIIDLWTPGEDLPVRLDFFGDLIESIRRMDPDTQRGGEEMESVPVLPVREVILSKKARTEGVANLKQTLSAGPLRDELIEGVSEGRYPDGVEWFLPLINESASLFDYLPPDTSIHLFDPEILEKEAEDFWDEIRELHAEREIPLKEDPLFLAAAEMKQGCESARSLIAIHAMPMDEFVVRIPADLPPLAAEGDAARIRTDLPKLVSERIPTILFAGLHGEHERVMELLEERGIAHHEGSVSDPISPESILVVQGEIGEGVYFPDLPLAVLGRADLFGGRDRRRLGRARRRGRSLKLEWGRLKEGDYVVHDLHGIALFRGLTRVSTLGQEKDMLQLEYAGGDILYVPVDQMDRVERYMGQEGHVPALHKLGGSAWSRLKTRVRRSMENMARELLDLYAMRSSLKGHGFPERTKLEKEFEEAFIYDETPDQLTALDEIFNDMVREKPMDRLVCGDVGYGKTEVAMRAAFKSVGDGRQVAVLVPTTVLAQQHLRTFRDRFAGFPVKIEMLSRFRTPKEQRRIVERMEAGELDIVIGTHRLLQKDIKFKNIGLVIVDEEQRFGVKHKETLRQLRALVDVLTLTATPIPRTLHLSLMGARDISTINTPPRGRVPIVTIVRPFDDEVVKSAIRREVERGGQVYVLHNRVQSIYRFTDHLRKLLPDLRFGIGHGQMQEQELASAMNELFEGNVDVFVCTTIIESGLDIPNVNTILIDRADRFGLAQLYQLRGRVGRGQHRAYAYFFYPSNQILNEQAQRRLEAIGEFTALGSGFQIAMRDLEIRGAGNLLGGEQHGNILAVGFDLYCRLLQETVNELRGTPKTGDGLPAVDVALPAYVPPGYIGDESLRLEICNRISRITTLPGLLELREELIDRFGAIPDPLEGLLRTQEIKVMAALDGVRGITETEGEIDLIYRGGPPVEEIMEVLEARKREIRYRFQEVSGEVRLQIELLKPGIDRYALLKKLLRR